MRFERVCQIEIPDEVEAAARKIWALHQKEIEQIVRDKGLNVEEKLRGLLGKIFPTEAFRDLTKSKLKTEDSLFLLVVCFVAVGYAIGEIAK